MSANRLHRRARNLGALAFLFAQFSAAGSLAAPTVGFVERFSAPGTASWTSGATNTNPGTGGFGGPGDGFLHIARTGFAGQLGARSSGAEYAGDWIAAGIAQVRFRLRDVDANQDLEVHFCIGNAGNFWQYDVGFAPPENGWGTFTVDLTDSSRFTPIIDFSGAGFARALRETDRILIRHDRAPYNQFPDTILGEFGLDEIELLADPPVPARAATWGAVKGLYR
jgi:hypothetical protein